MTKESNLKKVKVPTGYDPQVKLFYYKSRKAWACDYFLPSEEKIKFRRYLPKVEFSTERKAKAYSLKKRDALIKGILNLAEYKKLLAGFHKDDLNFEQALEEYHKITSLSKTRETVERDKHHIGLGFKYLSKELGKKFISHVSEKDIRKYRLYLIQQAKLRKESMQKHRAYVDLAKTDKEKRELTRKIRSVGLAPATAESYFSKFKKVFNKLYKEKLIDFNPCADVENIKIAASDRVRKMTFAPQDIVKIAESDYKHPNDFPLIEFVLFLAETGARSGEALHLEWSDIDFESGVWSLKEKPQCPTKRGLGWKPKWGKERQIFLSQSAMSILKSLARFESFGFLPEKGSRTKGVHYPANFVFTLECRKTKKRVRANCVKKSWVSLMENAGIAHIGFERFVLHDFRRYRNVVDECINRLSLQQRGEKLGNSARVNSTHYKGVVGSELMQASGKFGNLLVGTWS